MKEVHAAYFDNGKLGAEWVSVLVGIFDSQGAAQQAAVDYRQAHKEITGSAKGFSFTRAYPLNTVLAAPDPDQGKEDAQATHDRHCQCRVCGGDSDKVTYPWDREGE